jgi:hypothetical protein
MVVPHNAVPCAGTALDRWIRAHREHGPDGLKRDPRSDLGAVRRQPELLDEARA